VCFRNTPSPATKQRKCFPRVASPQVLEFQRAPGRWRPRAWKMLRASAKCRPTPISASADNFIATRGAVGGTITIVGVEHARDVSDLNQVFLLDQSSLRAATA